MSREKYQYIIIVSDKLPGDTRIPVMAESKSMAKRVFRTGFPEFEGKPFKVDLIRFAVDEGGVFRTEPA